MAGLARAERLRALACEVNVPPNPGCGCSMRAGFVTLDELELADGRTVVVLTRDPMGPPPERAAAQMFEPRRIGSHAYGWMPTGSKSTRSPRTIAGRADGYRARLAQVKTGIGSTGRPRRHCHLSRWRDRSLPVLAWWGNDNELFTSVSARSTQGWVEDPRRYSFCLWDLEVFWFERNRYVELVYRAAPDLDAYRAARLVARDA
jgi:hypothetical protein